MSYNPLQVLSTTLQNTNYNQKGSDTTQSSGSNSQQNAYTTGQLGEQQQLPGLYNSLLQQLQGSASGAVPSAYTNNPNLVGAYENAYNQNVAPQEAFQGGAGSPAIASNNALGLQQLLANQYNTGIGQYQNALSNLQGGVGQATNYGLGLPTGSNAQAQSAGSGTVQQKGSSTTSTYNPLALLGALLGGGF